MCQVGDSVLDVNFISSFALRDLGVLDFAMKGICHRLQVCVEEGGVEGLLVYRVMQHEVMRLESCFRINLVCFAELAFCNTSTLDGLANETLSFLALSHDFIFRSGLLVNLGSDSFVYLLSFCYQSLSFFLSGFEGCLIHLSHDGTDTEEQCHRKHNLFHVL